VKKSHRAIATKQDDFNKTIENSLLYNVMKPLFFCMRCCGTFFVRLQGEALFRVSKNIIAKMFQNIT